MSDDLRKLIDAVEVGTLTETECLSNGNRLPMCATMWDAFSGSVDAAIALCEVLMPGWDWWMNSRHYWDKSEGPLALIKTGRPGVDLKVVDAKSETPARALLLAVLRAKLMETNHGPH